jgi:hypothetical protein
LELRNCESFTGLCPGLNDAAGLYQGSAIHAAPGSFRRVRTGMYIHRGTIGLYVTVFSLPMSKCAVSVVCSWGQVILCILTKWHRVKLPSSMEYRGLCTQRFGDGADSAGSLHFLAFCDESALKTASARPGGLPSRRFSTFKRPLNDAIERCGSVDLAEQERRCDKTMCTPSSTIGSTTHHPHSCVVTSSGFNFG